ncbi:MAG: nucleoside triphosphate pyrophosphohydrolase, partial [Chlorobiaceae bacterium]|nr:nucleoside triphosphate pyrophosphohydrolase [Chlorobiaceae bacterium]
TNTFMKRFEAVESTVQQSGRNWQEFSAEELDLLWQKAKDEL